MIDLQRAEFKDMSVAFTCKTTPVLGVAPSMYTSRELAVYDQRFSHERFTIHTSHHVSVFLWGCATPGRPLVKQVAQVFFNKLFSVLFL